LKQQTDLLVTNDGGIPVAEKDGLIGIELGESVRISHLKCKGKIFVKRILLVLNGHNHLLGILE
jgi:hypothetical protein